MNTYFELVQSLIKDNDEYLKLLSWTKTGSNSFIIDNCINSADAFNTLAKFSEVSGLDLDRIHALTVPLLAMIPIANEPKAIADFFLDFEGLYDLQFVIDDSVQVLVNKRPTSHPKNDKKHKKYEPKYKQVKTAYIFGLEYDPKTKLIRLRYKFYPQKHWWGFRYEERFRSFDNLLSFIVRDLIPYHNEEQVEVSIPDDPDDPGDLEEMNDLSEESIDDSEDVNLF